MTSGRKTPNPWKFAAKLLADDSITAPPVMVEEMAERRGLQIRMTPLEEGLSGMIFLKGNSPVIVVNSTHAWTRQRFTIAHELGHFLLHMGDIGARVHVDKKYFALSRNGESSKGRDRMEIEANRFAAELLVPRTMLIAELRGRVVDVEDEELVGDLAKAFQVSRQMMAIRIGELAAK